MSIVIPIKIDATGAQPTIASLKVSLEGVEQAGNKAQASMNGLGGELARIRQLAGAAGIGMVVREVLQLADAYTLMSNRLQGVTKSQLGLANAMDATFQVAQRTRSEWAATNEAFVRITNATKDLGLTQQEVLGVTETISKAIQMSGASSAEASAGMLQLTQALSSGKLAGDEFRSVSESIPSILDVVAKQMGVTRGSLKQLSSEGKITSDVLIKSFQTAKSDIDAGFAKTAPTLTQAWQMFKNEMTKIVGESGIGEKLLPVLQAAAVAAVGMAKDLATALGPVLSLIKLISEGYNLIKQVKDAVPSELEYLNPIGQGRALIGGFLDNIRKVELKGVITPLKIELDEAAKSTKDLDDVMAKMLKGIKDPMKDHSLQIQALSKLWQEGKISADEYAKAVDKMPDVGLADWKQKREIEKAAERYKKLQPWDKDLAYYPKARGKTGDAYSVANAQTEEKLDRLEAAANGPLSREQELLKEIQGPMRDYQRDLGILERLHRLGKINASEFADALDRIRGSVGLGEIDRFGGAGFNAARSLEELNMQKLSRDSGVTIPSAEGLHAGPGDIELREANRQAITDANAMLEMEKKTTAAMDAGLEVYGKQIDRQKELDRNTTKWFVELNKFRDERSPLKGIENGFNAIGKEVNNTAKLIEDTMLGAFKKLEDAFVGMIDTMKLDLSGLVSFLRDAFARMAFRGLVSGIFDGDKPSGGGSIGSIATAVGSAFGDDEVSIVDDPDPVARRAPGRGGRRVPGWVNSDAGQEAITNITHKQHGVALATRDRMRSRS